ncbi:MAG: 4-hydroxybenzoate octaprenyltransferase [Bacteroidota bacterium]|nr:4-hydroxybenzoate octaprenyltransferase [Bacteroidota bacterium]MDP4234370.1 4-hydroxybenzoate octaprenyltransferase [Bacteroidota bacterium]MDP4243303.1 4-hydroxybenzoate octaprenyltransferase [Bacteroidota bacterium]MDP4287988.1 4-hydroxybenzoate octaprenyltransferase [Bacteroidota bacterium]
MSKFFSFVKIEHTLFSLPVIFAGMALGLHANQLSGVALPNLWIKIPLILGAATGARTIGFAVNRIVDRHIDARNPRTQMRELPSGRMKLRDAYLVLVSGIMLYVGCAAGLNWLCLLLAPIPAAVFGLYPFLKRFTSLAHVGLGASLALGPLGGYFAVRPSLDGALPAILLSLFTWTWAAGFDIIYSTSDEAFDRKEGLHSLPARFGSKLALQISSAAHFAAFLLLVIVYLAAFRGSVTAAVLLLIAGLLLYLEQRKSANVELAFFKINAIIGFVVLLFVIVGVSLA